MDPKLVERLVAFRRELHTFPELSLKEFQTQKRIKNLLLEFGVKEESITHMEPTALVVDLRG
jgi:metal-dependent amidase/aminoacylase/carboxypeptidase family protein